MMLLHEMADTVTQPGLTQPTFHNADRIVKHTRLMMRRYLQRDGRFEDVRAVRRGELDNTPFADIIASDVFEKPIVANTIDTCARDLAEMTSPMPSITCSSASMKSDAERRRADVRTKIAGHYANHSRVSEQMLYATDQYYTYSFAVAYVEPDYDAHMPRIVFEDPYGGYPEFDRWGRVKSYTKRWYMESGVLADLYPEYATQILEDTRDAMGKTYTDVQVELIRFWDKSGKTLVYASKRPFVLETKENPVDELPLRIAKKPWLDPMHDKGQFDDVLWVQMAKNALAQLQFEGAAKAVQAPLAAPTDVQEVPYGGDAILRSATPEKIRRVGMEMSNMTFIENQSLGQELLDGARYPGARATGSMDASIITGRGVQALMGNLQSQIQAAQVVFRQFLIDLFGLCFKMDEAIWPNMKKEIKGSADGTPYELTYTPSIEIKGSFSVDCVYGFAAGLDPNRAAVLLLQMRADNVISRDYMARQQPFSLNVSEEQSKIMLENTRDSIMQGIYAYAQSVPAMAAQGMDPAEALQRVAEIARGLQKGQAVEELVAKVFAPAPAPPQAPGAEPGLGGPPGEGGAPPGGPGVPGGPGGQQGAQPPGTMPSMPGQRPDISIALAGLTSAGRPQMSNTVSRRRAV